jgi:hypothetical protein
MLPSRQVFQNTDMRRDSSNVTGHWLEDRISILSMFVVRIYDGRSKSNATYTETTTDKEYIIAPLDRTNFQLQNTTKVQKKVFYNNYILT